MSKLSAPRRSGIDAADSGVHDCAIEIKNPDANTHNGSSPTDSSAAKPATSSLLEIIRSYIALTKPRVIELLLISTIPVMLLADRGHVHLKTMLLTLLGGWLGAACANTLNMVADADIDAKMKRTKARPLACEHVTPRSALIFGLILGLASIFVLSYWVNVLSAVLVVITIAFYVGIYTLWLKRRTWQNIIWGGAAGCMPALVGWAGQTGSLSWQPWVLFLTVFLWTPPHTWALAMHYREDYRITGIPMLPVIKPADYVSRQMIYYSIATVAASSLLIFATGFIYAISVVVCGVIFIYSNFKLNAQIKAGKKIEPMKVFLGSNIYLALLCLALSVDSILNLPLVFH